MRKSDQGKAERLRMGLEAESRFDAIYPGELYKPVGPSHMPDRYDPIRNIYFQLKIGEIEKKDKYPDTEVIQVESYQGALDMDDIGKSVNASRPVWVLWELPDKTWYGQRIHLLERKGAERAPKPGHETRFYSIFNHNFVTLDKILEDRLTS